MKKRVFLFTLSLLFIPLTMTSLVEDSRGSMKPLKLDGDKMLKRHNYYRELIGVQPLTWSEELAEHAQEWADSLAMTCNFEHQNGRYGESIFWTTTKNKDEGDIVDFWAKEEKYFNHDKPYYDRYHGKKYRHYSQMIWANTTMLGAARQRCENGDEIWVAIYDPKGNIHGERVYPEMEKKEN